MISIEQYADLCALMADTAGDVSKGQPRSIAAASNGTEPASPARRTRTR